MKRYLVVANQTLATPALDKEIRSRLEAGDCKFHVIVPMTRVEHLSAPITASQTAGGYAVPSDTAAALEEEAAKRARNRLRNVLSDLRDEGADVGGELGPSDPLEAIKSALDRDPTYDEIILSTLPARVSKWLGMDLPSRVQRLVDIPVTTVIAHD